MLFNPANPALLVSREDDACANSTGPYFGSRSTVGTRASGRERGARSSQKMPSPVHHRSPTTRPELAPPEFWNGEGLPYFDRTHQGIPPGCHHTTTDAHRHQKQRESTGHAHTVRGQGDFSDHGTVRSPATRRGSDLTPHHSDLHMQNSDNPTPPTKQGVTLLFSSSNHQVYLSAAIPPF